MAALRKRIDQDGALVEIPPEVLDCGHPNGPQLANVGYEEHPRHLDHRVRAYYCRTCRAVTYCDPS